MGYANQIRYLRRVLYGSLKKAIEPGAEVTSNASTLFAYRNSKQRCLKPFIKIENSRLKWKILIVDLQIVGFHEAFRSSALVIVSSPSLLSLGRLPRNRSIPVWFTRYPRTALSDRWRSLGITSLMNIGGIRYVHIHSYIGHHDQACVLSCKIQCISKFHEIKLKS
ncbi:hypothetical protein TNCV_487011 [Trichonephila clavipes]|nr:hypothetical protein TNCV_487011 [Trichonephila clavipes]